MKIFKTFNSQSLSGTNVFSQYANYSILLLQWQRKLSRPKGSKNKDNGPNWSYENWNIEFSFELIKGKR